MPRLGTPVGFYSAQRTPSSVPTKSGRVAYNNTDGTVTLALDKTDGTPDTPKPSCRFVAYGDVLPDDSNFICQALYPEPV